MRTVYAQGGVPDHWRLIRYDSGHTETPDMRREVIDFLKAHLLP